MTSITGNSYLDTMTGQPPKATGSGSAAMDQSSFLKLMTTQLKTQDPFDPVDNQQMVAQMAQFSSVAGIAEMNASMKSMLTELKGSRIGDAASWIGRSALVGSDVATPLSDGSYAGRISLSEKATQLSYSLLDENGTTVYSQSLGAQEAGEVAFAWNGKDASGAVVSGKPLRLVVNAENAKGAIEAGMATWTQIAGVQSPAGGTSAQLITGLGRISPEEAISLS